ncbi:MAG: universal stress protein [Methylobacteriaceae bacterium]|jgi:nucleotide-binding universal stress UspA family protein|nr:universal stress protein [Methylobacteriaceae bacterium]
MFKNILVPVDLADVETSHRAIEIASDLANSSGGTVRLLYVRSILPVSYMEFVPPAFDEEQIEETMTALKAIAADIQVPAERVSVAVRVGAVYNEVLDEVEQQGIDLVLIGSHRPTMATYLLGSNAATIVRHAKCAVLVIR